MGRWSHLDTDEERLPEGMVRIGYDADDETYTFRDERDGSIWESAPGCRYGRLRQISEGTRSNVGQQRPRASTMPMAPPPPYSDEAPNASFTDILRAHAADMARAQPPAAPQRSSTQYLEPQRPSWRHELMPLLHFFTLIGLFLVGVFWLLGGFDSILSNDGALQKVVCGEKATPYVIQRGDTCWAISQRIGVQVDDLLDANQRLDCDHLALGKTICLPEGKIA
ncbi:hypothetical protein MGG_09548 [Pyricularia oryzae 70-15]|uniref:LysM domain-containing protein n=3 Tax=Pyricularia oryzae TaxID=318829 RepID=G4N1B5_PYRO7|nr:uncharacterized protein MGG_09548 [Pyricularia oryzae 70-15]EHA52386.1 hypothetical protein MGG_09548 [Pyricularia oryzae 70-15]ELQ38237.1 hypothetical protein OOU_Y34scaffold00548g53 [Pyricularia oryzae Y34]KAI7926318.1 hypothetical protein M0657_003779 [Pyricularia oryzae]